MTEANQFHPLPTPGDIVWCKFPQTIGNPGPKPRPALVVTVSTEDHAIQVAYGTSQKVSKLYPGEFALNPDDSGYEASGLAYPTKFNLSVVVTLSFNSDWFACAPGKTPQTPLPKLGVLHACYMDAVHKAAQAAVRSQTSNRGS